MVMIQLFYTFYHFFTLQIILHPQTSFDFLIFQVSLSQIPQIHTVFIYLQFQAHLHLGLPFLISSTNSWLTDSAWNYLGTSVYSLCDSSLTSIVSSLSTACCLFYNLILLLVIQFLIFPEFWVPCFSFVSHSEAKNFYFKITNLWSISLCSLMSKSRCLFFQSFPNALVFQSFPNALVNLQKQKEVNSITHFPVNVQLPTWLLLIWVTVNMAYNLNCVFSGYWMGFLEHIWYDSSG